MKADLAIYTHVLGVPGQYESVGLMLSHKMDFNYCTNRDGFRRDSHILSMNSVVACCFRSYSTPAPVANMRSHENGVATSYHLTAE